MNVDDKENRNEELTLMKIQNSCMNGRALSVQPQETERGLEEQTSQGKPSSLSVPNIIIYINIQKTASGHSCENTVRYHGDRRLYKNPKR